MSLPSSDIVLAAKRELIALHDEWAACQLCSLQQERYQVVYGAGRVPSDLVILGEAPGAQEDTSGIPFIGPSGDLLNLMLQTAGVDRKEVFVTNVVLCRPLNNKTPSQAQMKACRPRLMEELYIADPKVIITMGATATSALFGKAVVMGEVIGKPVVIELPGRYGKWKTTVIPTYHPAFILRQGALSKNADAQKTFQHVCTAVDGLLQYQTLGGEKDGIKIEQGGRRIDHQEESDQ